MTAEMIDLYPLYLTFQTRRAVVLPRQPGPLWRGAIGARLRADVCVTGVTRCRGCGLHSRCAYAALFEPMPPESGLGRRFRDPPRPWALAPVEAGMRLQPDDTVSLRITLIAHGLEAWNALRCALERLRLGPAPLELVAAESRPPVGSPSPAPRWLAAYRPEPPPAPRAVRVLLEGPLRLQHEGRPLGPAELHGGAVIGALLRRLTSLGADLPDADPADLLRRVGERLQLVDADLRWRDAERTSSRQGRRVPLGGVVGTFRFVGDLEPYWPWLWAGQWTHVGKSVTMGLGRYRLLPEDG